MFILSILFNTRYEIIPKLIPLFQQETNSTNYTNQLAKYCRVESQSNCTNANVWICIK